MSEITPDQPKGYQDQYTQLKLIPDTLPDTLSGLVEFALNDVKKFKAANERNDFTMNVWYENSGEDSVCAACLAGSVMYDLTGGILGRLCPDDFQDSLSLKLSLLDLLTKLSDIKTLMNQNFSFVDAPYSGASSGASSQRILQEGLISFLSDIYINPFKVDYSYEDWDRILTSVGLQMIERQREVDSDYDYDPDESKLKTMYAILPVLKEIDRQYSESEEFTNDTNGDA